MKRDKINDDPSESNSPLDQTTDSSHRNPFPNMENLRYSYPRSFYDHPGPSGPDRRPVRTPRQVKLLHFATCQKSTDTQSIISRHDVVTPGCVRSRTEDTPGTRLAARARPRENGHLYTRTLEREHMMDTDTPM